jgi:ABC-type multidrug transport system ATPase subunit
MNIIEVENLTKVYTNQFTRKQKRAVDDISFAVEAGQIFGFLGPNGSGKTTTIGMLLNIINPSGGSMRLFGDSNLNAARKRIGATLETPNFYPYLSGVDNLNIVAAIKGASKSRVQDILHTVKLTDRQKDTFKAYSLGMKQRLALASAMLADPDIIILDEPANGLDPEGIREIRDIIKSLAAQGKTVFLSSHLLDEVEQTCTHVAVIQNGKLVGQGSVAALTSKNAVRLTASDINALKFAVERYEKTISSDIHHGSVYAVLEPSVSSLEDGRTSNTREIAALNRYLCEQGVYVSHLSEEHQSLEDAFLEMTGSSARG